MLNHSSSYDCTGRVNLAPTPTMPHTASPPNYRSALLMSLNSFPNQSLPSSSEILPASFTITRLTSAESDSYASRLMPFSTLPHTSTYCLKKRPDSASLDNMPKSTPREPFQDYSVPFKLLSFKSNTEAKNPIGILASCSRFCLTAEVGPKRRPSRDLSAFRTQKRMSGLTADDSVCEGTGFCRADSALASRGQTRGSKDLRDSRSDSHHNVEATDGRRVAARLHQSGIPFDSTPMSDRILVKNLVG